MARPFVYGFEWDPRKAQSNAKKHGIAFDRAAAVFLDPRALTEFDSEHSHDEDRWVTLGMDGNGTLLVVCHTFSERGSRAARIRIISARKASRREAAFYGRP